MDSLEAAAQFTQVKNALYFLEIQSKGFLGPTLRQNNNSVGMQAARSSGVVVDEMGKLRCPSVGSTTAYEFTDLQMSNCILQPPPSYNAAAAAAGVVQERASSARRARPRTFSWSNAENARIVSAKYPGAHWKEESPGYSVLSAGTGRVGDDRRLWKMVNRRWHSDAVVDKNGEPGLARAMESFRTSPATAAAMRREALDLDSAPVHVRKLADAIDSGYPMGKQSYRVQHVPKNMQIEEGFELRLSLASVGFDHADMPEYERDLPDQVPKLFRFPESTPGVIFDDSDKADRRKRFHEGPVDGIVRGRFRVKRKAKEGTGSSEREVHDLEYVGKLDDTRETYPQGPASSHLLGHVSIEARQRVKVGRNQARSRIENAKRSLVYLPNTDRDLKVRPGSDMHVKQLLMRHRSLFGDGDAERLSSHLVSNEALRKMSSVERPEREWLRNAALSHVATSAVTHRLATLLDGTSSSQIAAANDPDSSRYYNLVQGVLERWKASGSNDPFRQALQNMVWQFFDLEGHEFKALKPGPPIKFGGQEFESSESLQNDEGFRALALALYQTAQEGIGKPGPVRLYKGVNWKKEGGARPGWASSGEARVPIKPLTGMTADKTVAEKYAFGDERQSGALVETTIPSEHVFSMPGSGFGNPSKEEVTVLGGRYPSKVETRLSSDAVNYG